MTVYNEYSRNRVGFFLGLTGGQLTLLVLTLAPVLWAANHDDWLQAAGLLLAWTGFAALIVVPVRGRSAVGWLVAAVLFSIGRVAGWTPWRSRATTGTLDDLDEPDLPGALAAFAIHEGPPQPPHLRRAALVQDRAARTWAVTAALTHRGIQTAGPADRDLLGRGLAGLLDVCSRGELVNEVLFVVRTVPDDGAERAQWVARHRSPASPAAVARINDELAVALTSASVRTEAFVTVVVPESRIGRRARDAGGGLDGRAQVMAQVMAETESQLRGGMGMTEVRWLTSPELAAAVRTGFAPGDRAGIISALADAERDPHVNADVPWALAGPSGADAAGRHYRHDAWNSVSATIKLPPRGVSMGALAPILTPHQAGERRSVLVAFPIKPQAEAERETWNKELNADMGEGLQQYLGIKAHAKDLDNLAKTRGVDVKLARGHSLTTPYAVCTITVPRTVAVGDATHHLESAIRRAGFAPQLLDLVQDTAFAASTIPLGVSLTRSTL